METSSNFCVSVIIPTKNEEHNITRCLQSILAQAYSPIEILVIDNNSRDKTVSLAKQYTRNVFLHGPERSAQRNYGTQKAKGTYFLFLDADMELEQGVITECVTLLQKNPRTKACVIPETLVGSTFLQRCRSLEKECYIGDDVMEGARFFESKAFFDVGGYDATLIASEDWDLHQRVKQTGAHIARTKARIIHHEKEGTLIDIMRKKYYYGLHLPKYVKKHPVLARLQYRFFRPAFFKNWKKLVSHPTLLVGLIVIKCAEFSAGGMGYLIGVWQHHKDH
ncbi:MAG TPA: glycosyltransferase [Patescibacteria group bacterium]|nr:glycosyltransferase [Patescibacteria group bacterium]